MQRKCFQFLMNITCRFFSAILEMKGCVSDTICRMFNGCEYLYTKITQIKKKKNKSTINIKFNIFFFTS